MAFRHTPTIVCGDNHTLCLSNNGNVASFGESAERTHGHRKSKIFPPKIIPTLKNITFIAGGRYHTACLDIDGKVYSFGKHYFGNVKVNWSILIFHKELIFHHVDKFLVEKVSLFV